MFFIDVYPFKLSQLYRLFFGCLLGSICLTLVASLGQPPPLPAPTSLPSLPRSSVFCASVLLPSLVFATSLFYTRSLVSPLGVVTTVCQP